MKKKVIIICLAIFIVMLLSISSIFIIKNINRNINPEELSDFSWEAKLFKVNDDYTYTFSCLVTVQEVEGIDTIKYQKNGKEITFNGNGKQKIGIDFDAVEDTDYEFKITPVGKSEKKKILNVKRKVSGDNTLTPANWIFDAEPDNWYDYNNQKWANIYVEAEGVEVYYVWIPRYQYKLNQTSQRSDVKFILGTSTTTEIGYQIPEAFWWDKNDDGIEDDGEQLTGYWITKYQLND